MSDALPTRDRPATSSRIVLWAVVALPLVLALAPRDLWAPEEPKFGLAAHEMVAGGDWLVTHTNGKIDAEKPPLLFWMMAAVEVVVGRRTPVGMRIPGALLAALAVVATGRLARRWFRDRALADTAAIVFGTTGLIVWNGPRVGMDLALAAFAVLALEGATAAVRDGSWWGAARLGVGVGFGLLAKGPHALYVPLAGVLGGWLATRRRREDSGEGDERPAGPSSAGPGATAPLATSASNGVGLRLAAGVLLGVAIFCAWLVPALLLRGKELTYDGDTFAHRLLGQLTRRVSGEGEPHIAGPLYLLPLLLALGMPWTPFAAVGAVIAAGPRRTPASDRFGLGAALAGVVVPLVLLSIPASKRETYLVPLIPCASILAAYAVHRAGEQPRMRASIRIVVGCFALLAVAAAIAPLVESRWSAGDRFDAVTGADFRSPRLVAAILVGAVALGAVAVVLARSPAVVLVRRAGLAIALVSVAVFFGLLPIVDPAKSLADAAEVARREAPGATFEVAGTRDPSPLWWDFGTDRIGPRIEGYEALAKRLAPDAPKALVLARGPFWRDRTRLAKPSEAAAIASLEHVRVLWERRVNGYTWHLLTNAPQ